MDKTISLIMPFRERIELFQQMLDSLKMTTVHPKNVELIIGMDDDDKCLDGDKLKQFLDYNEFLDITIFTTPRHEHMVNAYWNPASMLARGRWIMDVNDDSVFKTEGWDVIINEAMSKRANEVGDDVLYGKVDDCYTEGGRNSKKDYWSCWSVLGKEAVNALGFFYDPCIHVGGADHVQGLTFLALNKMMREDRIVGIYDVMIDHNSSYTGQREVDYLMLRQREINKNHPFETTREHERDYAMVLRDYIEGKRYGKSA